MGLINRTTFKSVVRVKEMEMAHCIPCALGSVSTFYIGGLSTVKNKYLCLEMIFIHGRMHV